MATNASIRVVKSAFFKGGTRTFSNRYHFNGGTPSDATHWHTLMDNVTAAEKLVYSNKVTITEALGYAAGSDVPVASKVYSLAGTYTPAGAAASTPLECCALIRWSTAARSTKNHPIYCFSYMHQVYVDNASVGQDTVIAALKTLYQTYATAWITGFSDGTITAVRATPQSAVATGSIVEEYATHRDFPYTTSV
jgi:hypothetical protein